MSDNKVKKTYVCFNDLGDIIVSYYSSAGFERMEIILSADDIDNYLDYLMKSGLRKVLDKYNLVLKKK